MRLSLPRSLAAAAILGGCSVLAAAPAQAQDCALVAGNLVQNCGFESGFTGWSASGIGTGGGSFFAHSGSVGLRGGAVGYHGDVAQSIATVAGQSYAISFWYNSTGYWTNELFASFGGTTLIDVFNTPATGWTQYSFIATATSSSSELRLGIRNDPSWDAIDDAAVVTATPEPASLALMGSGLVALGGTVVRRRRRTA